MFLALSLALVSQQAPASSGAAAPLEDLVIYDPSPAHPFGRRHPKAAPELSQFEFMLGEFDGVAPPTERTARWTRGEGRNYRVEIRGADGGSVESVSCRPR